MMKKILLISSILLAACSTHSPVGEPQAPLDLNAVQEYNKQVYSGKKQVAHTPSKSVEMPLNASDHQPKVDARPRIPVVIAPTIGYYHGYRLYRGYHYY